ncbi:tetratricopeptide repeat protein [Streptomyces pinistramenti]|uniref:tetratricopeptide repeat protein n=1 Tax=Streptomyces pinistramenti TaxID=2884812 RepID=UPI001D066623|nr:tetratricopeptide repeat protein [Streptomyces pinistramenti]MCB5910909.1 tetratricopeptide repeat protein [Streptomyces pinistramenti]
MGSVDDGASVSNVITGGTFIGDSIQAQNVIFHQYQQPDRRPRYTPNAAPAPPGFLADRDRIRARLDAAVAGLGRRSSPLVVALTGPPGVGKTDLALYWAKGRNQDFPGGVLYVDMSPSGAFTPRDTAGALEALHTQIGTRRDELPGDVSALSAYYRTLTSADPYLVFLDGVVNPGQVRELLPGHPASLVLVTSRNELGGLRQTLERPALIPVDVLDDASCEQVFLHYAETDGGALSPEHADRLSEVVATFRGWPAAARVAGARAADLPAGGDLGALFRPHTAQSSGSQPYSVSEEEPAMNPHFAASYGALDPLAQRVVRALGRHPARECADELIDALAGGAAPGVSVRSTLLAAQFLERPEPGRVRLSGAVHDWAGTLAPENPAEESELPATQASWYLHRAAAAAYLVSKRWRIGSLFVHPALLNGVFASEAQALDAMEADLENAVAMARTLHEAQRYGEVCELTEALRETFFRRKHPTLWTESARLGAEAAERLLDDARDEAARQSAWLLLARMRFELAFAHFDRGGEPGLAAAHRHYTEALDAAQHAGHARTRSSALEGLGMVALERERPLDAGELFQQALQALGGIDHPRGRALLHYHLGRAATAAHRHEEAAERLLDARRRFADLSDHYNEARALTRYAQACLAAGDPDEAVRRLDEALPLFAGRTAPKEEADARLVRGDAYRSKGESERARADWQSALDTYDALGSLWSRVARSRLDELSQGK